MERSEVLEFLRSQRWAIQASTSPQSRVQAAVVGFAINEQFEIVFDTINSTRKAQNLRSNPNVALVVGGVTDGDERTVQYEGVADFPEEQELKQLQELYFAKFPDGRSRLSWTGITYVRVRPRWLRFSNFNANPPVVVEFTFRPIP
jgi:uncharacterized protein YhbP (UPF0306 family)